jgi:hypothetical protein
LDNLNKAGPSRGESDMLMQNSNTGAFEVYDISNNKITSATSMGQVGLEWQVGGFATYAPNIGLLAQAMATVGASAAPSSASGAILGSADTSQQALLATPTPL